MTSAKLKFLLGGLAIALSSPGNANAAPTIGGLVNAATFKLGPVAPGTLVSIFGTGFSATTITATSVPLPTGLAGTTVMVNDIPIPLLFVSPGQINAQLPFGLANGNARLTIKDSAGVTGTTTLTIVDSSPGIFTKTLDGKGEAIAVHADNTLIARATGQNAKIGETIVVYCTGLGEVMGSSRAGSAAQTSPLPRSSQQVEVLVGGRSAAVSYSGLTPGSIGLYQVNFIVPAGIGGDVDLVIRAGVTSSNSTTINVSGTYIVSANYTGTYTLRNGGTKYQLDFFSLSATSTPGLFSGSFRVSLAGVTTDQGPIAFAASSSYFVVSGRSQTGSNLVALMDTLDAGQSFFGLFASDLKAADSWYATFQVTRQLSQLPPAIGGPLGGALFTCAAVEGASIYAQDGTYLGKISSNSFAADSIANPFGTYGSEFSSSSIYNTFGQYGSPYSSTSAFNSFATSPPIIYVSGRPQWYLTTNTLKLPAISPSQLNACIGR